MDAEYSPRLIAHRGASAYARENSLEAITAARLHGATDVEVDVQQTADGNLVVTHDSTCGGRYLSTMSIEEYAALLVGGSGLVELDEVVASCASADLGLYLDVKQLLPGGVELVAEVLERHDYRDRTIFSSFRTHLVLEAKRLAGLTTSVLFIDPEMDLHALKQYTGCDFVHPCFDDIANPLEVFDEQWAARAHDCGVGIITWNTVDQEVAEGVLALGVEGICSDDPAVLVRALTALRK